MQTLEQVTDKVQRILMENYPIRKDKDGDIHINHQSAHVYVRIKERSFGENQKDYMVQLFCPLINSFEPTPEVFKWVALEGQSYFFGHIQMRMPEDGYPELLFVHTLLAVDLDESELLNAVGAVLYTSADLDTELHQKFGGQMFGED